VAVASAREQFDETQKLFVLILEAWANLLQMLRGRGTRSQNQIGNCFYQDLEMVRQKGRGSEDIVIQPAVVSASQDWSCRALDVAGCVCRESVLA